MKWERAPLGIIILPFFIGFIISCISGYFDPTTVSIQLVTLIILSLTLYFFPIKVENYNQLVAGSIVSVIIGIFPTLIFFPWCIIVWMFWFSQNLYVWNYNMPPFRIGVWIGMGASSGVFFGAFFSWYLLSNFYAYFD